MTAPTTISEIKALLKSKNLAPLKNLGQNFLIDCNFLQKITQAGELTRKDLVLEVGPGLGGLTEQLLHHAGQVVAVEYDRGLFAVLKETLAEYPQLYLFNQDFLEFDLKQLVSINPAQNYKVIANLPYYITSPVVFKLLESRINWRLMVFLVQKEVALRMAAQPGGKDYGTLTVMLNFYGEVELLCTVPRSVFYPVPKVDSAVVKISPRRSGVDWELYSCLHQVVQAAFGQRRKTILNALTKFEPLLGGKVAIKELLIKLGIDPGQRGETIGVEQYTAMAQAIQKHRLEGA
ncbi:MAG TPA: 16S rRNA (adenine(1518)-N(6)/adenine(1519)-N(6))-dimethyltransferase RsmA [Bacillota bacterium]